MIEGGGVVQKAEHVRFEKDSRVFFILYEVWFGGRQVVDARGQASLVEGPLLMPGFWPWGTPEAAPQIVCGSTSCLEIGVFCAHCSVLLRFVLQSIIGKDGGYGVYSSAGQSDQAIEGTFARFAFY